jgi:hypothetical protein
MIAATITSGHPVPVPNTPTGYVSEHVITRANPCGLHIGVAMTVCPKQSEAPCRPGWRPLLLH